MAWIFYKQRQDVNRFLLNNGSLSRTNYIRIIALASIDALLTLPMDIVNITVAVMQSLRFYSGSPPFYLGWTFDHTDDDPTSMSYATVMASSRISATQTLFVQWTSPILALTIFGLFGATSEARASYCHLICRVIRRPGHTKRQNACSTKTQFPLPDAEIGKRPEIALNGMVIGYVISTSR